jgi:serine/threonine protein kinase
VAAGALVAGSYEVGEPLGQGATAIVYRARHIPTGRDVALKVLKDEPTPTPRALRRFLGEARSVAGIDHPNVVQIHDAGLWEGGRPYLAMELVRGRSLATWLGSRDALPVALSLEIASQVLRGLSALHQAGVLHRDVKPANILLVDGQRPACKLCDFGLAKQLMNVGGGALGDSSLSAQSFQNELCGTPDYISPEQVSGKTLDSRSDLYAVAVTLFRMLCGAPPFKGRTPLETIALHLHKDPPLLRHTGVCPDLPEALQDVITRALAKDPRERPRSALLFAAELTEIRSHLSAAVHRRRPGQPTDSPGSDPASQPTLTDLRTQMAR